MRILFIGNTRIGDFILSSGLIDRLLIEHPSARLTLVCGAGCLGLTRHIPNLEHVIVLRKKKYNQHWFDLWKVLVKTRWDLVVDLRNSAISYTVLAGKTLRLRRMVGVHKVEEAGHTFGLAIPPEPKLWMSDQEHAFAQNVLGDASGFLVLGPGATLRHKTWPSERFLELAQRIIAPSGLLPGAKVVLLGSPDERPAAEPILRGLPEATTIDLMDKADLLQAAAVISRAALYIGNDNGQMHLSAATGTPTLGLFGATPASIYRPWCKGCAGVQTDIPQAKLAQLIAETYSTGASLMESLSVDKVYDSAREILLRTRA